LYASFGIVRQHRRLGHRCWGPARHPASAGACTAAARTPPTESNLPRFRSERRSPMARIALTWMTGETIGRST
jgi:hypothetical protein